VLQAHWQACCNEKHLVTDRSDGLVQPALFVTEYTRGYVVGDDAGADLIGDDDDLGGAGTERVEEVVAFAVPGCIVIAVNNLSGRPQAVGDPQGQAVDKEQGACRCWRL
jgi:hypothetical protein